MDEAQAWRGDLRWSIKESFFGYVSRSGGQATTEGVSRDEAEFVFERAVDDGLQFEGDQPRGTARFTGTVRASAHGGMLDVTFGAPEIEFGSHQAVLRVHDADGDAVELASLELGDPIELEEGVFEWIGVTAKLTPDGSSFFNGMYQPYSELDSVSLSLAR